MSGDFVQVLIWILRIVLPCILFWISFGPRIRTIWQSPPVPKDVLLAHREIMRARAEPAPKVVANLVTVNAQQAPMLFQEPRKRDSRTDTRGEKNDKGDKGDRQDRGDKGERSDRGDRPQRGSDQRRDRRKQTEDSLDQELTNPTRESEEERKQKAAEDQMHLESLVNFVAFSRHQQQRFFLPDDFHIPPPPPVKPQKVASLADSQEPSAAVQRANAEAQMVLRGAIKTGVCGAITARRLHAQLNDLDMEILAPTFELIVEACLQAHELKDASNFLMLMEGCGATPSGDLLDRVMELYLQHKKAMAESKNEASDANKSEADSGAAAISGNIGAGNSTGGHMVGGHMLDVEGLKRLVTRPPPPPPPPQPVHTHYASPVGEYSAFVNYGMWEQPSILMPTQWQPRMPHRMMNGHSEAIKTSSRDADAGKDLPAFSIPDEFAVKGEGHHDGESDDADATESNCKQGATSSSASPGDDAAARGTESSTFNANAAVFVPGDVQAASTSTEPNLNGDISSEAHVGGYDDGGNWQYIQEAQHFGEHTSSDGMISVGMNTSGFEFSPEAPAFTPMGGTYAMSSDQAAWNSGLRPAAMPFVPGSFQEGDTMMLPDGTRGQVVGPPVLMPINAVMPMMHDHTAGSDDEWSGDDSHGDHKGRQPARRQNGNRGKGGAARLASGALAAAIGPGQAQKGGSPARGKKGDKGGSDAARQVPVPPGPVGAQVRDGQDLRWRPKNPQNE